ncbi:hypothetical protein MHH70_05965 [Metasolibacillus sp. FSL H7-0170]|uniref:hypothetical protein n=1 Tax=Metasolibacillus sp. FSL H7-0170 TaxID=2921431 RepID=UPI003158939C
MLKKVINNEQGLSLVEVVASIIILTIILLSFFAFFINTAKTTKTSSTMFDATYYAQREMELFYNITQNNILNKNEEPAVKSEKIYNAILNHDYEAINQTNFTKIIDDEPFDYNLVIHNDLGKNLTHFTISVCKKGEVNSCTGSNLKATMFNIYEWRTTP